MARGLRKRHGRPMPALYVGPWANAFEPDQGRLEWLTAVIWSLLGFADQERQYKLVVAGCRASHPEG